MTETQQNARRTNYLAILSVPWAQGGGIDLQVIRLGRLDSPPEARNSRFDIVTGVPYAPPTEKPATAGTRVTIDSNTGPQSGTMGGGVYVISDKKRKK